MSEVRSGPSDKFKADAPDASPLHALVRRLWESQLSDASDDHKRLMALAATEFERHLHAQSVQPALAKLQYKDGKVCSILGNDESAALLTETQRLQRRCYELEKALQAYIVACAYADEASLVAAIGAAYREAVRLVPAPVTTTGAKQ